MFVVCCELVLLELDDNGFGFWYACDDIDDLNIKSYFGFKIRIPIIYGITFKGVYTWKMPTIDACMPLAIGKCDFTPFGLPWDASLKEKFINFVQCMSIFFFSLHNITFLSLKKHR